MAGYIFGPKVLIITFALNLTPIPTLTFGFGVVIEFDFVVIDVMGLGP